jgi:hypothetical protein
MLQQSTRQVKEQQTMVKQLLSHPPERNVEVVYLPKKLDLSLSESVDQSIACPMRSVKLQL